MFKLKKRITFKRFILQLDWYLNGNFVKSLHSDKTYFYTADSYGDQQIAIIDQHGNSNMITFQISGTR